MTTERFVRAGGVRARVVEEGAGFPVLLVHGVAGWAENWKATMPALATAGFRAIACDLPGFGQTERARDVTYFDPEHPYYARFVHELLDALGIERAHLVGHSLGGAVATVAAVERPTRFDRFVLVAPGGYGLELAASFRISSLWIAQLVARLAPAVFVRGTVNSCFANPSRVPPWVYADAERYAKAGGSVEFARVMRQTVTLRGPKVELRDAWDPRVRALRLPTLVLWGRQDAVLPVTDAQEVIARLPHAQLVVIEDAGHLVMLEQPDEFDRALLAFLRD